ncbi:DUF4245 domain-containing protein [Nocardioides sp. SYSU D00038]|uniref:DUF4245 domain-containing protein n=1 Tax=Nocardioides sp. SYSU D00038 TaxID=2812554 RepID=UPI001968961F|nr:DUF4245 domain-containing protein [Nocardioides sp. SYSU D00038]
MSESGAGGRYHRSANGLIASLVVTVLAVALFVVLRNANRTEPVLEPESVDYLDVVAQAADGGTDLVHPRRLPEGWIATSIDLDRAPEPGWGIGILTDDDTFVGLRQEDADVRDLVEEYVDENAVTEDPIEVPGAIAPTWQGWSDDGGDLGWSAEVGGETVLVYGSASAADQRTLIGLLTTERPAG